MNVAPDKILGVHVVDVRQFGQGYALALLQRNTIAICVPFRLKLRHNFWRYFLDESVLRAKKADLYKVLGAFAVEPCGLCERLDFGNINVDQATFSSGAF